MSDHLEGWILNGILNSEKVHISNVTNYFFGPVFNWHLNTECYGTSHSGFRLIRPFEYRTLKSPVFGWLQYNTFCFTETKLNFFYLSNQSRLLVIGLMPQLFHLKNNNFELIFEINLSLKDICYPMKVKSYTEKVSNNAFQAIHPPPLERASINDVTQPWKFSED